MGRSPRITGRGTSRSFGFRPLASCCALRGAEGGRCPPASPLGPRSAREPSAVALVSGPPARPGSMLYPDSPRGTGRAGQGPSWGKRAQLWELPAWG